MLVKDQIEEFLPDFKHKLQGLCQVMLSVRYDSLPSFIPVRNITKTSTMYKIHVKGSLLSVIIANT